MIFKAVQLLILLLISSCTFVRQTHSDQKPIPDSPALQACSALISETEQAIFKAGVVDSQTRRITGFPYLRVGRFLASYRHEVTDQTFPYWVDLLQQHALSGWRTELQNLPGGIRNHLQDQASLTFAINKPLLAVLFECGTLLRERELDEVAEQNRLREEAVVPADYRTWQQILGLYPLTAIVFRSGINRWHQETQEIFKRPLADLPIKGQLRRYKPGSFSHSPAQAKVAEILRQASANPLRIPLPSSDQINRLFEGFAPIFEIDVASNADKIGRAMLISEHYPYIETTEAVVYRHLSHTRLGSQTLLQLNYSIWFPSRPKSSDLDLLGGRLDGIIWRVTLSPDGQPLLYDSIHQCGCYHLFFPLQHSKLMPRSAGFNEPAFTPQQAMPVSKNDRIVIRIASTTHYIQRVYSADDQSAEVHYYSWDNIDSLRSLPLPDGSQHSLFGEDGIVNGSERGERYLFWPMGIPNSGAMRQWGNHATAFVGRRHFDDARLLDNSFVIEADQYSSGRAMSTD